MKKVTLYQVNKTEKIVSGDHLELRQYSYDQITPIRNSDEFVIQKDNCVEVTKLPIQKYVFCQKNWKTGEVIENIAYACFDDELLKLIQCERSKFENLNNELVCKSAELSDLKSKNLYLEDQWLISKTKLCKIEQMGFWKRLVYLFKGFPDGV